MSNLVTLRPHHILDIVRNIGNDIPIAPHKYGHLVLVFTQRILSEEDLECTLVLKNDDICKPCRMLTGDNYCTDILPQLEIPTSKQAYNDALDQKIPELLHIQPGTTMKIRDYLHHVSGHLDEIVLVCAHPKEDIDYREKGMKKGLHRLLTK